MTYPLIYLLIGVIFSCVNELIILIAYNRFLDWPVRIRLTTLWPYYFYFFIEGIIIGIGMRK